MSGWASRWTLMIQDLLADPEHAELLAAEEDRRDLTPLFTMHVVPYGEVKLDMRSRIALGAAPTLALASELGRP